MIEKILVKLEADVKDYVKDMEKADKQHGKTEKSGNKVSGMLGKIGGAAGAIAGPLAVAGGAVLALGSALSAMALKAASNRKELERFARQANTSTGEFAALAFATRQYGIDAESVADITKDLSDRFGEFATAGSGAFQDFADVVGLTKDEARKAAVEFGNMSGQDAIQAMVSQMEKAGASGNQMTFVLESMGSELSRLQPLFAGNGKELDRLTGRYNKLNSELAISEQQAEELKGLSESFDLVQSAVGKASDAIGARFAPYLSDLINSVIEVVPAATNTIIDFFNSFVDAENIKSIRDVDAQINEVASSIERLEEQAAKEGLSTLAKGVTLSDQRSILKEQLEDENARLDALNLQRQALEEQNKKYEIQAALKRDGGDISVSGGSVTNFDKEETTKNEEELEKLFALKDAENQVIRDAEQARIDMLAEFAMTKEERLIDQYAREMQMLHEFNETALGSDIDLNARKLEAAKEFRDNLVKLKKDEAGTTKDTEKKKEVSMEDGLRTARMVGNALFEDNKLVKAGLIVADTAAGIMRAVANYGLPQAIPFIAATAALGLTQLANVQSASKGGGSVSGGAGGASATITNDPKDFEAETSNLDITSNVDGVSKQTNRVSIDIEDSEDFLDALAERVAQRARSA
jgi:hypothetical protein